MIILITGASHTEKTALAQKILEKYIGKCNKFICKFMVKNGIDFLTIKMV